MNFNINNSSEDQIKEHLLRCSDNFVPSLSSYTNIDEYSKKIFEKAQRIEFFGSIHLEGLIAYYVGDNFGYITNVSVTKEHFGTKIASQMMSFLYEKLSVDGKEKVILEVNKNNDRAISFYKKNGFNITENTSKNYIMVKNLRRDYNLESKDTEDHKYVYNFDFDVMHNYMVESFKDFFIEGNLLELGSFEGEFTKRLLPFFSDITCVEASEEAVEIAKNKFGDKVVIYNSLFEDFKSEIKYDNIVLTHVLEHIDDRISLLEKIKNEWLSDKGVIFIVCPNANAASRQIAVEMGLIKNVTDVTESEKKHGHTITYTLDKLKEEVGKSGLDIVYSGGIFFKALANFQWDQVISQNIVTKEYLDACYKLGKKYPDLCSSILIICQK